MKLKNVLIVVKDIERSRQFYHDLFSVRRLFRRIIPVSSILRNVT